MNHQSLKTDKVRWQFKPTSTDKHFQLTKFPLRNGLVPASRPSGGAADSPPEEYYQPNYNCMNVGSRQRLLLP